MNVISLEDAMKALTRRPGVLVGPGATCLPGTIDGMLCAAMRSVGIEGGRSDSQGQSYRAQTDSLAAMFAEEFPRLRDELCEQIRFLKPSLDLPHLARAGWSACISLTDDLLFESAIRDYLDSLPTSVSATVVDGPGSIPPERTIPIYKLLGSPSSREPTQRLAISSSELLLRQQYWQQMLKTYPDYVRESPLFVFGCAPVVSELQVVVGVLLSQPRPTLSRIMFLKEDQVLKDPTLMALCTQLNASVVDASMRELCAAIASYSPRPRANRGTPAENSAIGAIAAKYETIVALVPRGLDVALDRSHLPSLIDGLFRPAAIDWQPFAVGLDLRRSVTEELKTWIGAALSSHPAIGMALLAIRGEAGVGKTIAMKRAAYELAASGHTVLWCRRASGGWGRSFRALASELAERVKKDINFGGLAVFCDDPWGLRMDATELMGCFERFAGRVVFVFAWRNSDFFSSERMPLAVQGSNTKEVELGYELDASEWKNLGVMLKNIGAVSDQAEADLELSRIPSRNAKDILCSLWYLVPETRSQLSDSLRDEYCRLGSIRDSLANVAQEIAKTSIVARKAYEYVTVTSNLDLGIPVEVLVRALGINYDEWIDMIVDGRPLWGLLYDESDPDSLDVYFRTRNEIVTRVLLDLVNGGVGHAGEHRILVDLMRACDGGSAVYRNFVLDVLVRSRGKLQKILSYEQGIELFDVARAALAYEDRLLEHHKGIWIDDVGKDPKGAYQQLERALASELHPNSDRDAPVEHIHTSMASAIVKLVKSGEQERVLGFQLVRDHLRRATSATFYNAHTAHVSANLLFELAQANHGVSDELALSSIAEALQEIERALQLIGAQGRNHFRDEKSITMLTDLQGRIVRSLPDIEAQKNLALQLFEQSGSQIGFEVVARALLADATTDNRGSSYNAVQDYVLSVTQLVNVKDGKVSIELESLMVDLHLRWRVQRFLSVDWSTLCDRLKRVLEHVRYRDDVIKKFYYAVALFHLGQITEANATFAGLRRLQLSASPREIRCYYLGKEGSPKRMQGTLERKHEYAYVLIKDLQISVPMRTPTTGYGAGRIVHPYVAFSLNGPMAVLGKPGDHSVRLP